VGVRNGRVWKNEMRRRGGEIEQAFVLVGTHMYTRCAS
jgi:hypothetical protein